MGLRKCHPIKLKTLTVMGSQKHPSTLTNFLPEYHSMHTRDISQEVGNGHMTNTNKILGMWGGKTRRRWPSLTTVINPFFQRIGTQKCSSQPLPVLITLCPLLFSSPTSYFYTHTVLTCTYKPKTFSSVLTSISPDCLVPFPHSPAIKILRFTPAPPTLLLIPLNQ